MFSAMLAYKKIAKIPKGLLSSPGSGASQPG
jgi:hypothetical protein